MSDPIELVANGHRWWAVPGWEAFVREALAPNAESPEALPAARAIKQNRVRTVAYVPSAPGGPLYIKRFRAVKSNAPLAWRVKGTPAAREWAALRRFRAAGVECPEPVVLGEVRDGWGLPQGAVLATREVPDCREVARAVDELREAGDLGGSERLARQLARIAWTLFEAGGDHPDMHLGNFLVRPDGAVVTLDLHSVRLWPRPIPRWLRRKRLYKLAHSFGPSHSKAGLAEVEWLAWGYASFDTSLGSAPALFEDLLRGAAKVEAVRLKSRDRRCLVDSTLFAQGRAAGRRLYRRRAVPEAAVVAGIDAAPLATVHAHPYLRSRLELIATPEGMSDAGRVLRKTYTFVGMARQLGASLGEPAPLRTWKAARACEVRGIPTAAVYALALDAGPLPQGAAVFMEWIEDARMLHHLARAEPPLAPSSRRRLARDLGALLGRFHRRGLRHHDLAGQNVLCRPSDPEDDGRGGWDLWIVDLDEVRTGAMPRSEKLRALVHLGDQPGATRADRLRFFRAYLEAGGREVLARELSSMGVKGLGALVAAGVSERARARAAREASRDRPPRPPAADSQL